MNKNRINANTNIEPIQSKTELKSGRLNRQDIMYPAPTKTEVGTVILKNTMVKTKRIPNKYFISCPLHRVKLITKKLMTSR
jgi:hypothetical protein